MDPFDGLIAQLLTQAFMSPLRTAQLIQQLPAALAAERMRSTQMILQLQHTLLIEQTIANQLRLQRQLLLERLAALDTVLESGRDHAQPAEDSAIPNKRLKIEGPPTPQDNDAGSPSEGVQAIEDSKSPDASRTRSISTGVLQRDSRPESHPPFPCTPVAGSQSSTEALNASKEGSKPTRGGFAGVDYQEINRRILARRSSTNQASTAADTSSKLELDAKVDDFLDGMQHVLPAAPNQGGTNTASTFQPAPHTHSVTTTPAPFALQTPSRPPSGILVNPFVFGGSFDTRLPLPAADNTRTQVSAHAAPSNNHIHPPASLKRPATADDQSTHSHKRPRTEHHPTPRPSKPICYKCRATKTFTSINQRCRNPSSNNCIYTFCPRSNSCAFQTCGNIHPDQQTDHRHAAAAPTSRPRQVVPRCYRCSREQDPSLPRRLCGRSTALCVSGLLAFRRLSRSQLQVNVSGSAGVKVLRASMISRGKSRQATIGTVWCG